MKNVPYIDCLNYIFKLDDTQTTFDLNFDNKSPNYSLLCIKLNSAVFPDIDFLKKGDNVQIDL